MSESSFSRGQHKIGPFFVQFGFFFNPEMIKEKRKYDLNMINCSQEAAMFKDQPRDIKLSGMNRVA